MSDDGNDASGPVSFSDHMILRLQAQLEAAERRYDEMKYRSENIYAAKEILVSQLGRARELLRRWRQCADALAVDLDAETVSLLASPPTTGVPTRESESGSIPSRRYAPSNPAERRDHDVPR